MCTVWHILEYFGPWCTYDMKPDHCLQYTGGSNRHFLRYGHCLQFVCQQLLLFDIWYFTVCVLALSIIQHYHWYSLCLHAASYWTSFHCAQMCASGTRHYLTSQCNLQLSCQYLVPYGTWSLITVSFKQMFYFIFQVTQLYGSCISSVIQNNYMFWLSISAITR